MERGEMHPEMMGLDVDLARQEKPVMDLVESNEELGRFLGDVENGTATDGGIQRYVEKFNADFVPLSGSYSEKTWASPRGIKVRLKLDSEGHSELSWSK